MLYNTAEEQQAQACVNYLVRLIRKGKAIEVRDATRDMTRSLPQNRYLHVILAYFAGEYGCTQDEAKAMFKRCSRDLFVVHGKESDYVRSTASLSVEEMSLAIDRFIKWAAEGGIDIPSADDYKAVFAMQQEAERNKPYL